MFEGSTLKRFSYTLLNIKMVFALEEALWNAPFGREVPFGEGTSESSHCSLETVANSNWKKEK